MSDEVIGRNRLQDTELLTLVNYLTFGSVIRYWHPDIEQREKRDLQADYLGNSGSTCPILGLRSKRRR